MMNILCNRLHSNDGSRLLQRFVSVAKVGNRTQSARQILDK